MSLAVTRAALPAVRLVMHAITDARPATTPRRRTWRILVAAPFAGATVGAIVGAVSRWWMRLISDDPDFSWSGTIFIVLAFTVMGAGHGIAWAGRHSGGRRRWSTVARVVAAVLTLPIFTGAGAMMLPTVAGASLARWRTDWPRSARAVATLLALPGPIVVAVDIFGEGVTASRVLGAALLAATYVLVVRSLRAVVAPLDDGWRMRRWHRIVAVGATVLLLGFVTTSTIGIAVAGT
jgi:hypothetical protein